MKYTLAFLLILLSFCSKAQYWLPKSIGELVTHTYYTLSYNEENEQANWVAYKLTREMIQGVAVRKNKFKEDPDVETGSAKLVDYKGSGYDRGHLCPAAAMKINAKAMSESFYMSNMSPQVPGFNRGKWKSLEAKVRKLTVENDSLYVISGPVFKNNKGEIGPDHVTIPGYYFKVIYFPRQKKTLSYLMPNRKIEKNIDAFVVPLDSIERISHIHFNHLF
ncbi:DNA/RNA non-specific endonuclease [Ancylomarina sp. 16SWW S1-10-2]|uniref:DNA/RNA non-specific endonuclease n=1 Tax=Ancylomarina sp. 16SWW S1-10-2 TaxID=2499681 RepID=UPI0012AD620E